MELHPREVANKSPKDSLRKAIDMALQIETDALRLNTRTFNVNRYKAISRIKDYDELKDRARSIKEKSIRNLPELVERLTMTIRARGGSVYLARTKQDAAEYVKEICKSNNARLAVKSKSITSEEIGLNQVLENAGIEVAETDLAEFILQVSKEQPSHIVAPAIHRSRERISTLFKEHFQTEEPLDTGEQLTEFARAILRQKFISADVGISGANLIAAEEGALLLVESEGNIRLVTQLPSVHIAIAGVEKIISSKKEFGVFVELLAASGTGQSLTSYTNVLEPPLGLPILNLNGRSDTERKFHLVLIDNGRMQMRADDGLREALYCIRCSACMNVCANFQAVGGHAFGGECYTGGIGGAWTVGTTGKLSEGRFAELCTGCSRCIPNCPVRIDVPKLNALIKNRLMKAEGGPSLQKLFFGNFAKLSRFASIAPKLANRITGAPISKRLMEHVVGLDRRRSVPPVAEKSLEKEYRDYRRRHKIFGEVNSRDEKVILFADVYTNYSNPSVGMATIRVFDRISIPITLSRVFSEGRATQSQGLLESARRDAVKLAKYLEVIIENGSDVIVAEPSVLAMFRHDYKNLIDNYQLFELISKHSYEPIEYLNLLVNTGKLNMKNRIVHPLDAVSSVMFYHPHCQMKSIGIGNVTKDFFARLGLEVEVSDVECCGMAGSFGYKKDYYDLSKNIGNELVSQIRAWKLSKRGSVILASGTSCREQISDEIGGQVYHPIQYLEKILK